MSAQFLPAVAQALEAVGADVIVACMRTAVERHVYDDDNNKRRMFHKVLSCVFGFMWRCGGILQCFGG